MKSVIFFAALFLSLRIVTAQEVAPRVPPPSTNLTKAIFSTSHRFVVKGFGAEDGSAIAQWIEEVARRVEGLVGTAVPMSFALPMEITLSDESNVPPRVIKSQGYIDGHLQQRLILVNPSLIDQEDMLEGACWLVMNRYVISRQLAAQREVKLGTVPDWLSIGAAQSLYHELRARNARMMLAAWRQNQSFPIQAITELQFMPDGRWNEKALCGLFAGWLASLPDSWARWGRMFDRLATGGVLDAAWLAQDAGFATPRDTSKAWDVWLAQQQHVQYEWGRGPEQRLDDLKKLLEIDPDAYGIRVEHDVPSPVSPAQLIDQRKKKWMGTLTERVGLKLQWLTIGQPPELQDVIRGYVEFFETLSGKSAAYHGGLLGRGASDAQLKKLLARADASLVTYEGEAQRRDAYLDAVSARLNATGVATWPGLPSPASDPQDAERSKYLDQLELKPR